MTIVSRLIVLIFILAALAQPHAVRAQDIQVPSPDLSALDPDARTLLQQAMSYFERQRGTLDGGELGLAYGRLGIHYLAHDQVSSAIAAFQNARALDATNYRWPYFLGMTQSVGGNSEGAAALFGQALRLNPADTVSATRLGLTLIDAGKPDRAESLLTTLVNDPGGKTAAALAGLGRIAIERGDFHASVRWYEDALAMEPQADALHRPLATGYRAIDDSAEAERHDALVGQRLPVLRDSLLALLQAHRQPSAHFIDRGDRARDAGQVAQAAVFYDFAAAVNPADETARTRLAKLRGAAQTQAPVGAPATAKEFFERGVYHAATSNDSDAIKDYEKSLTLDPESIPSRVFLGNAQMRSGRYAQAAAQYAQASARDEKNAELKYRQGIAWMAANRCDEAEPPLLAGYDLDQTALRIVQAIARLYATCPVDDAKRRAALKYAQLLYNAQPSLETSATLAMVLAANDKFEDAADYQRQAIFEGLKTGRANRDPTLAANLERYAAGKKVDTAWPADHPIFYPPRPEPQS